MSHNFSFVMQNQVNQVALHACDVHCMVIPEALCLNIHIGHTITIVGSYQIGEGAAANGAYFVARNSYGASANDIAIRCASLTSTMIPLMLNLPGKS